MSKKYDVIVIGAGNGGLSAAATMALNGKKTLLVEKHNLPGGFATSFVRGRFEFEASLHELCGWGPLAGSGNVRTLFEKLGIADRIEWCELSEAYRMITIKEKLDINMPIGKENFLNKLEEYAPGSRGAAEEIFSLMQQLSDGADFFGSMNGFNLDLVKSILNDHMNFLSTAGYSVNEVLDALGTPQAVRDIFTAYWSYLGAHFDELSFTHYFIMLHSYIVDGAVVPKGRSHMISSVLLDRFEELGGEAWFNCAVKKIIVKDNAVKGVILEDGTEVFADHIICNASPYNAFLKLIDKEQVPDYEFKKLGTRKLGAKGFAVFIGLDKTPEELGIENYSFFIYDTVDTVEQFKLMEKRETNKVQATVCLNIADPECSPKGTTILYMTKIYSSDTAWDDVLASGYTKAKRECADEMISTFEENTGIQIRDSIEEIEIASPMTYARYTDAPNGTIYGFEATEDDGIVKRIMMSSMDDKIKNLRFAGGYSIQLSGYAPAYASGQIAANATLKDMEKEAQ